MHWTVALIKETSQSVPWGPFAPCEDIARSPQSVNQEGGSQQGVCLCLDLELSSFQNWDKEISYLCCSSATRPMVFCLSLSGLR